MLCVSIFAYSFSLLVILPNCLLTTTPLQLEPTHDLSHAKVTLYPRGAPDFK